jgi:hypothetical protein
MAADSATHLVIGDEGTVAKSRTPGEQGRRFLGVPREFLGDCGEVPRNSEELRGTAF